MTRKMPAARVVAMAIMPVQGGEAMAAGLGRPAP